jgi:hypothetical protein
MLGVTEPLGELRDLRRGDLRLVRHRRRPPGILQMFNKSLVHGCGDRRLLVEDVQ